MREIVHNMYRGGKLRITQSVIILAFAFFPMVGSWYGLAEGQNATTNTTSNLPIEETTRVNEILNNICGTVNSGIDTQGTNNSVSQDVVEIRCILRETRNAISTDSANIALELIEAADRKLATDFGNNDNSSDSDRATSLN
ncbi:MAG TPA: hypothetical protein VKA09_09085 [Nitrososphaeraceae archaeon]|nr:hypothetical protein [Nitrososphaeraceae archaeon]